MITIYYNIFIEVFYSSSNLAACIFSNIIYDHYILSYKSFSSGGYRSNMVLLVLFAMVSSLRTSAFMSSENFYLNISCVTVSLRIMNDSKSVGLERVVYLSFAERCLSPTRLVTKGWIVCP
jgi:hypothetical protein